MSSKKEIGIGFGSEYKQQQSQQYVNNNMMNTYKPKVSNTFSKNDRLGSKTAPVEDMVTLILIKLI